MVSAFCCYTYALQQKEPTLAALSIPHTSLLPCALLRSLFLLFILHLAKRRFSFHQTCYLFSNRSFEEHEVCVQSLKISLWVCAQHVPRSHSAARNNHCAAIPESLLMNCNCEQFVAQPCVHKGCTKQLLPELSNTQIPLCSCTEPAPACWETRR